MNKFLILLSSLFALTFFGCNNDEEELDLIGWKMRRSLFTST